MAYLLVENGDLVVEDRQTHLIDAVTAVSGEQAIEIDTSDREVAVAPSACAVGAEGVSLNKMIDREDIETKLADAVAAIDRPEGVIVDTILVDIPAVEIIDIAEADGDSVEVHVGRADGEDNPDDAVAAVDALQCVIIDALL